MRDLLTCAGLVSLLFFSGCGTEGRDAAQPGEGDLDKKAPQPISPPPSVEEGASDGEPSGDSAPLQPSADGGAEKVGKKAKPADEKSSQYPHESLVAAAGNSRLTQAYRACEETLRQTPEDEVQQLQRAYLVFAAGEMLAGQSKDQRAMTAFRTAFDLARQLVDNVSELSSEFHEPLAEIYYNGARVAAVDGNVDVAKSALQQAVTWGYSDMEALRTEPDLASVRALPEFDAELESWREARRQAVLEKAQKDLAEGETFPFDFSVTTISDKKISLADYEGQVVIVDIWGTWCPPCREEVPSFIKLQEQYGEEGLRIVGLNYENGPDEAANTETVKNFVESNGINYPCALGTEEIKAQIPQFRGFPTTLLLDRTGTVRLKLVGLHEFAYLEALVSALLQENAPSS